MIINSAIYPVSPTTAGGTSAAKSAPADDFSALLAEKTTPPADTADTTTAATAPAKRPSDLLGDMHILSSIKTTLPNGQELGMFRFDRNTGGALKVPAYSDGQNFAPTKFDKIQDEKMMDAFTQMAAYFHYQPSADDIELTGTAAIDLKA